MDYLPDTIEETTFDDEQEFNEIIKPVLNIGIEILFMLVIADYAARYGFKKAVKLIVASGL